MYYEEQWERLNEFQRATVEDNSPACVVNANVGSGKTTVLIAKILYLHVKKGVPVGNMIVLTFTNKAAGEIRERLLALEPDLSEKELVGFGTFHSVAMNLLKTRLAVEDMGWTREFMVMEPEEETELALEIAKYKKLKLKYKNRLKKRMEQEYGAYRQGNTQSRYKDDLFLLFQALKEEKQRQNKMSFSDLIEVSTELLAREESKPDWIIVDEVQDSDRKQIDFIAALKGENTRLFAVGDPNQLIYSWRGSEETLVYYFKQKFQAQELSLPVNYRSSKTILEAAKRFLQYGNTMAGNRESGELILIKNHYDPFQEALYLAERICKLHNEGLEYGEIAVFYRLQSQSDILEKVFEKEGIPFSVSLKKTLRDIPVLDWFVKVLRYSCSQDDDYAGETALSHPSYGEGMSEKKAKLFLTGDEKEGSLLYEKMLGFRQTFSAGEIPEPLDIYAYFSMNGFLKPTAASFAEDKELTLEFCKRLVDYSRENKKSFMEGTMQFLNSSALYGIQILKEDENPGKEKVRLMTLHASKGLEFSYVFIIGVNQGLIPLSGKSYEEEEEERRLFFVGMTRAKDGLELSYYTNPGQPRTMGGPGRYLNMMPRHLIEWDEMTVSQGGQETLQQLRKAVREERDREEKGKEVTIAQAPRYVRHPKYGTGILVNENELTVEAEFENYGRKEFLKAFSEFEIEG